jgi:hypothetical protein
MKILDLLIALEDFAERPAVVVVRRCVVAALVVASVGYGIYQIHAGLR